MCVCGWIFSLSFELLLLPEKYGVAPMRYHHPSMPIKYELTAEGVVLPKTLCIIMSQDQSLFEKSGGGASWEPTSSLFQALGPHVVSQGRCGGGGGSPSWASQQPFKGVSLRKAQINPPPELLPLDTSKKTPQRNPGYFTNDTFKLRHQRARVEGIEGKFVPSEPCECPFV